MELQEQTSDAREVLGAARVYGEPYEKNGLTVIPAMTVAGIGGAGQDEDGEPGGGRGFGLTARPSGAWVVEDGEVTWMPAVDINRIVFGGQVIALAAILVTGRILVAHSGRRGRSLKILPHLATAARLAMRVRKVVR
jgi:uncharacterized spore protein YtfJ